MKFILSLLLVAAVMLTGCTLGKSTSATDGKEIILPIDNTAEVMDKVVIVGYEENYRQDAISLMRLIDPNARIRTDIPAVKAISFQTGADLSSIKMALRAQFDADQTLKDKIRYIEPSYKRYQVEPVKNNAAMAKNGVSTTDDYYEQYQWGMRKINAEAAWSAGYTGTGVTVAVVDTGID